MKNNTFLRCAAVILAVSASWLLNGAAPDTVYASKFGFNPDDATECLQKAINSGARKVIVENMGKPWKVRPLKLRSNLHMLFKAGAVVEAKRGEYYGKGDTLFSARNCQWITMEGEEGATLRMWKKDYHNRKLKYSRSQWRNALMFDGCYNVTVKKLIIKSSGGDGIYLGRTYGKDERIACRNVLIEDCIIDDHHRQGITVISAVGLRIRNCTISGTQGTEPEAGIDFEPNYPDEMFRDCIIENCRFINNNWSGINFSVFSYTPADIIVRNCYFSNKSAADPITFCFLAPFTQSGGGVIRIENCVLENSRGALSFMNFVDDTNYKVILKDVELKERPFGNPKILPTSPICFSATDSRTYTSGGITFDNVKVTGYKGVPLFAMVGFLGDRTVQNVTGTIIHNGKVIDVADNVAKNSSLHRPPYKLPVWKFQKPETAVKPGPGNTPAFRAPAMVYMWADRGEVMDFTIEHRFFDRNPNTSARGKIWKYKVISPSGKAIALPEYAVPQSGHKYARDFKITAEESGIYKLELITLPRQNRIVTTFFGGKNLRWGFGGAPSQKGILNIRNQPGLGSPNKVEGYFEVPAGVKEFWIDSASCNLAVTDPAGKVYKLPLSRSPQHRLEIKRANPDKREIWKLKSDRFVSQVLLFSENLPGLISPDPSKLLRSE